MKISKVSRKYKYKVFEIGNIVRKDIIDFDTSTTNNLTFENIRILVLGGSQAAKIFGEELPEIFIKLKNFNVPIKVFQQCLNEIYKKIIRIIIVIKEPYSSDITAIT